MDKTQMMNMVKRLNDMDDKMRDVYNFIVFTRDAMELYDRSHTWNEGYEILDRLVNQAFALMVKIKGAHTEFCMMQKYMEVEE